ncbi:hypothetical protein [Paracoccus tegillarcae]|uniref:GNAT family N-acetyltransferase n=1 Tax=Paracoccus tegillarcae TaxID=1529068 RepID=A0A2K9EBJ4_9RHOB|nr:hypothetical protein [Paracoccus tegillarcae]AUH32283.1 hypothetical protein CUV01_01715 [Paracoccus tegillarcae]
MDFERLTLENESEILALLQDVWPRLYGATGCPQFSADYLRWLYGGPDCSRHLLLGCREKGRLVGLKAYLSRDLLLDGQARSASLSTHLTIRPDLDPASRLAIAAELSRLHPLTNDGAHDQRDALLAFFEGNKTLVRNITRMAMQQKLNLVSLPFTQAIVNVRKVNAAAAEFDNVSVRQIQLAGVREMVSRLLSIAPESQLVWCPTNAMRIHHLSQAPGSLVLIAENDQGQVDGLLGGYRMDWLKNGSVTQMFIIESLITSGTATSAKLLAEAAQYSAMQGFRGVVIENSTMIEAADARRLGIMPTQREMILAVRSRLPLPDPIKSFSLDVK